MIDDENKDYGASGVVEAISVKNSETADYRGTLVKQKTGVYKHINGNEYTVVTNVSSGDTVNMDFLFSCTNMDMINIIFNTCVSPPTKLWSAVRTKNEILMLWCARYI